MAKETEEQKAKKYVNWLHELHKEAGYLWLNEEACESYRKKALALTDLPNDVGARRQLRIELQNKYGLQEIEAINILNGRNVADYLLKYHRIENKIPTVKIRPSKDIEEEEDDGWN